MLDLVKRMETIAHSDAAVVITGESGTGKELVARALHEGGERRLKPFVAVNCAAFPDTLIESELFGYERGAFTGATTRRDGRFKAAHGGTLFLDEIAELSPMAQAKLLRVLQEGTIEPLGSNVSVKVDVRIISATHRNLRERIAAGLFREDLYYRINTIDLAIPPLRARGGDLAVLVQHFIQRFSERPAPDSWHHLAGLERALGSPVPGKCSRADAHDRARDVALRGRQDRSGTPPQRRSGSAHQSRLPRRRGDGTARHRHEAVRARVSSFRCWPNSRASGGSWLTSSASLARISGRSSRCTASALRKRPRTAAVASSLTTGDYWPGCVNGSLGAALGASPFLSFFSMAARARGVAGTGIALSSATTREPYSFA